MLCNSYLPRRPRSAIGKFGKIPDFLRIRRRSKRATPKAELERGDYLKAQTLTEYGLKIVESRRSQFFNQELRGSYFASVQDYYLFYTDLLMRLNQTNPGQGFDTLA